MSHLNPFANDAPLLSPPPPPPGAVLAPERSQDGAVSGERDSDRLKDRHSVSSSTSGGSISVHSQPTSILMPAEVPREPTGSTIVEPDSVFDDSGRSFHGYKEGKYFLPNDAAEQDRLDLQHAMLMMATGGILAHAPMDHDPEYVMDVATGTGIWAIQFAQEHPGSHVIGTDLSKIQPALPMVQNCEFVKDDAEEEWLYRTPQTGNKMLFDYVHLRMVFTCFADNQVVMRHAFDNMRPGGWIEYCDLYIDPMSRKGRHEGSTVQKFWATFRQGMSKIGRDMLCPRNYKTWLAEVGFVDIKEQIFRCPLADWPQDPVQKKLGQYALVNLTEGARGFSWKALGFAGLGAEEKESLIAELRRDAGDPSLEIFHPVYVVYARKPHDWEVGTKGEEDSRGSGQK
ncbi:S-adenosyl-L-methionine-dependent methyltransferase [Apiospora arundinis]